MKITVKIFKENDEIGSRVFSEGTYRFGRSEFSDVVLSEEGISRSHLEIRITESTVYMTNMSTGGKVKVNRKSVETAELSDGDEIKIGKFRIIIFFGERDAEPQNSPDPAPAEESPQQPLENNENFRPLESDEKPAENDNVVAFDRSSDSPESEEPNRALAFESEGSAALKLETQVEVKPLVAKLVFSDGPRAGEEILLETFEVTFGRSKKADVYLDDDKLSRIHAKLVRVGMGYRLLDLNSRNGTYVNGVRVLEHPLASFDEIQIGRSKIKFLIHDLAGAMGKNQSTALISAVEQTKSVLMNSPASNFPPEPRFPSNLSPVFDPDGPIGKGWNSVRKNKATRNRLVMGIIALAIILAVLMSGDKDKPKPEEKLAKKDMITDIKPPPSMPKEYLELSPETQRQIEGYFVTAQRMAEGNQYDSALGYLKRIHDLVPFYKNSRELQEMYGKKWKERQLVEAQEKAKRDDKQDLAIYLEEGLEYLREAEFDKAAEAFNSAIVIEPSNATAIKGLKAAEYKVRRLEDVPPDRNPEEERRKAMEDLFQKALAAFSNKGYQETITLAQKILSLDQKGETQFASDAKQLIEKAKQQQKEEFEPFLLQAQEKCAEGDYNACRDLCEEMLKRDPGYEEAKQCVLKARKQLNRLAKEAYTHCYILDSMNRLEEAKQYCNRAKNYVRPGDDYYQKVMKKLEQYE